MLFLTLKELPENVHDELEGEAGGWDGEEKGTFKGGLGKLMPEAGGLCRSRRRKGSEMACMRCAYADVLGIGIGTRL
jgi:hypothetical protein